MLFQTGINDFRNVSYWQNRQTPSPVGEGWGEGKTVAIR